VEGMFLVTGGYDYEGEVPLMPTSTLEGAVETCVRYAEYDYHDSYQIYLMELDEEVEELWWFRPSNLRGVGLEAVDYIVQNILAERDKSAPGWRA